eukprot:752606-Hanusia_phi.AAC.2
MENEKEEEGGRRKGEGTGRVGHSDRSELPPSAGQLPCPSQPAERIRDEEGRGASEAEGNQRMVVIAAAARMVEEETREERV